MNRISGNKPGNIMRIFAIAAISAVLSGCGIIYTAPGVSSNWILGGTGFKVDVVRLTPETTMAANLEEYVPPRLPLAFQPGAINTGTKPEWGTVSIPERLPPDSEPKPYTLGIGDVVLLNLNTEATLDNLPDLITLQSKRQGLIIQDDGAVAVPNVGRVRIADLSLQEAEAELFQAVLAAGIAPEFNLEVAEFNSQRVTIGGGVGSTTLVPLTIKPLYLYEAIHTVGGARVDDPETARVQLVRGNEIYSINLERFKSEPRARRIVLQDRDSIFVGAGLPEDFYRRLQEERGLFKERVELGAVQQHYAYITGEVGSSGRVELPFERTASLADVLWSEAHANIRYADYSEIYVLRASSNPAEAGGITAYNLNAANAINLALASHFQIHHNDVVFIPEQPVTSWNRAISQIIPNLLIRVADIASTGL